MKDYKKAGMLFLLLSVLISTKAQVTEANDSLIYQNQDINGTVAIQNPSIIKVNNSTVNDKGHLHITSTKGVVLDKQFVVQKGGILEINIGPMRVYRYSYDSVGNIKSRKRE